MLMDFKRAQTRLGCEPARSDLEIQISDAWKWMQVTGDVRFWVRRWLRTIPPYVAALAISWVAVRIARGQSFDFGYLIFVQKFYLQIPFFLVSWSLCVEEHFYLLLPLAMVIVGSLFRGKGV